MRFIPLSLALLMTALSLPASAKTVRISFPKNSYCGSYAGKIAAGDAFLLKLGGNQKLVVKSKPAVPHAVFNQGTNTGLSPSETLKNGKEVVYITEEKGDYNVMVQRKESMAHLEFCVYNQ